MAGAMFESEKTRILKAIVNNDVPALRTALKDGENPHYTDRKRNTYLHYVCTMYRPVIFHIIVGTGINLNAQNRHGNTALHVTALQNECCHVGDLLAAGINPNIKNKPGIFEAVSSHDVDAVLHLLHCWSRVDTKRDGQTLRQYAAALKFHDIVYHIDVHMHTLSAIHAVLEENTEKAWTYLSHPKCDVNFLNYAADSSHILQYAIKLGDVRLVRMICKANINVNIRVTVEGYLKAPLFFCAIGPNIPEEIMWPVLKANADFTLKDERGRNAAIYALDKTNRKISCEVVSFMMKNGLDLSQRDCTGVTLRDVVRFAVRKDILTVIDTDYVKLIRSSNMKELERLAVMGYDSLLINFNYRDTFIYASGNETEDVVHFTQWLPMFCAEVTEFHQLVQDGSHADVSKYLATCSRPDLLVNARDKGGRSALHLSVLYGHQDVLQLLLAHQDVDINVTDNLGRSAYHYACSIEEEAERKQLCHLLLDAKANADTLDNKNRKASYYMSHTDEASTWIAKERKTHYGMVKQLACVDKYQELCHLIKHKRKPIKHFESAIKKFKHPVAQFENILRPLMPDYRDLLFVAMDNGQEEIATRLIHLGADWTIQQLCEVKTSSGEDVTTELQPVTVYHRANQLGMKKLTRAIDRRREFFDRNTNTNFSTRVSDTMSNSLVSDTVSNSQTLEVIRKSGDVAKVDQWMASDGMEGDGINKYNDVVFEEKLTDDILEDILECNVTLDSGEWGDDSATQEEDSDLLAVM
ncbi:putative ankyrin repeat protein RF_0381 isoform X2 [Physella acuta]|uniref:putative ankyrin repeat protein RF_0381 isoform X2 n=1 Tax=Physella acuta TaxID=109671 RepID=UPI0027DDBB49|nr:putative ankyrin repeat protein RF_0381 isoform X2 [Physella acuta]